MVVGDGDQIQRHVSSPRNAQLSTSYLAVWCSHTQHQKTRIHCVIHTRRADSLALQYLESGYWLNGNPATSALG